MSAYLCHTCGHALILHTLGRCVEVACPCSALDIVRPVPPVPVPLAQDQREADLAEVAVRLRAAVVDGHYAQVEAIARACSVNTASSYSSRALKELPICHNLR